MNVPDRRTVLADYIRLDSATEQVVAAVAQAVRAGNAPPYAVVGVASPTTPRHRGHH